LALWAGAYIAGEIGPGIGEVWAESVVGVRGYWEEPSFAIGCKLRVEGVLAVRAVRAIVFTVLKRGV